MRINGGQLQISDNQWSTINRQIISLTGFNPENDTSQTNNDLPLILTNLKLHISNNQWPTINRQFISLTPHITHNYPEFTSITLCRNWQHNGKSNKNLHFLRHKTYPEFCCIYEGTKFRKTYHFLGKATLWILATFLFLCLKKWWHYVVSSGIILCKWILVTFLSFVSKS